MTSLMTAIEAAFVGMDSATLQHAYERFRPRLDVTIQANERYGISNNFALQRFLSAM